MRPSWSLSGKYTHMYKQYIVGKVHCGENACVLVGRCEENTHICTNKTSWGKCIVGKMYCGENAYVLVCRCEENTHICTNDTLWGSALWEKSVRPSWRCGENTHIRTNDTLWGKCIVGKMRAS